MTIGVTLFFFWWKNTYLSLVRWEIIEILMISFLKRRNLIIYFQLFSDVFVYCRISSVKFDCFRLYLLLIFIWPHCLRTRASRFSALFRICSLVIDWFRQDTTFFSSYWICTMKVIREREKINSQKKGWKYNYLFIVLYLANCLILMFIIV